MNKLDIEYINLCINILENGTIKSDRTGTGTISLFGTEIRYQFNDNKFPILTTKKIAWKTLVIELIWFLKGDTNIKFLIENNCHIWDGDAYKNYISKFSNFTYLNQEKYGIWRKKYEFNNGYPTYEPLSKEEFIEKIKNDDEFAKKWGELGPTYGKQWRNWDGVDQINNLIINLKNDPDSRRLLVSAWNVEDIDKMILPPCHFGFQCYTSLMKPIEQYYKFNEYVKNNSLDITGMSTDDAIKHYNFPIRKLSLKFHMRSVDVGLGLPFNLTSYALLLKMLSSITNMLPNELICTMGDTHIYLNQIDEITEQINREPRMLPILKIKNKNFDINNLLMDDFELLDYDPHPSIKMKLSN